MRILNRKHIRRQLWNDLRLCSVCLLAMLMVALASSIAVAQEPLTIPEAAPADTETQTAQPTPEEPAEPEITAEVVPTEAQKARLGVLVLDSPGRGVFVSAVDPFGAAMRAGLLPGDYILKVGDQEVSSPGQLRELIAVYRPGDRVNITRWRLGVQSVHEAKLTAAPDLRPLAPLTQTKPWPGVTLTEVEGDGARINSVIVGSPAEGAGLLPGDVVVSADGRDVDDVEELVKRVRKHKPDEILELGIRRGDQEFTLMVPLGGTAVFVESFYRGPLTAPLRRFEYWRPRRVPVPDMTEPRRERGWYYNTPRATPWDYPPYYFQRRRWHPDLGFWVGPFGFEVWH